MTRYGMALDVGGCTGCQTCVVACQMNNALRPGVRWAKVDYVEKGRWPEGDFFCLPRVCLHCDDPACVSVCPTGASARRSDGVVLIDYDICIGCGVCMTACPYGARTINSDPAWFFGAQSPAPYEAGAENRSGVAEKCTFCAGMIDDGLIPACVSACVARARAFGDLDDENGGLWKFIHERNAENIEGTSVYYAFGGRDFDSNDLVAHSYRPSNANSGEGMKPNPPVLAASAAAVVAAGTGIAAAVKRSRGKDGAEERDNCVR